MRSFFLFFVFLTSKYVIGVLSLSLYALFKIFYVVKNYFR